MNAEAIDPMHSFRDQAFRVESLPDYTVGGRPDPEMVRFLQGDVVNDDLEWIGTVRAARARGARVLRLRLVSDELSDYERYELLAGYKAGVAAGEEIRVARRSADATVADFWAYDDASIEWMRYDETGEFIDSEVVAMDAETHALIKTWLAQFDAATPLRDFLAALT